jgi:hypothetical protein
MATAAPHVKLLRQLASAKDDYLSGAFDISWDGAKATLYLVFGRPSHAVFDTDQAQIEGEAAIDALLAELPRTFAVSEWRRAMSPQETLSITIDELAGPFVRLAGSYADDPISDANPEWWSAEDSSPDLAFGLADFPLLPGGRPLWTETSPEEVNLAERLAELPPSIVMLTGAKLRAAAVVSGGDLIDAVWIDADDQARGEAAGMAILGATKGTLAGYALDDPRVAEALTMLWRVPLAVSGIEMAWLDPASMLAAFRADGLDRVLVIDAPVRGVALFSRGGLVAVYSETQRSAVASPERLRSLLSQARGRLTVMARKPRPVAAGDQAMRPSAVEFFAVAEHTSDDDAAAVAEPVTDEDAPAETEAASPPDSGILAADVTGAEDHAVIADGSLTAESAEHADTSTALDGESLEGTGEAGTPLPPPLSTGTEIAGDPPNASPLALESAPDSERPAKRPWWFFGRARRDRAAVSPPLDVDLIPPGEDASGWHVRQPEAQPRRHWYRGADAHPSEDATSDAGLPPTPGGDASGVETSAPVAEWEFVEQRGSAASEPVAPTAGVAENVDVVPPFEPPAATADVQPDAEVATAQELLPADAVTPVDEPLAGLAEPEPAPTDDFLPTDEAIAGAAQEPTQAETFESAIAHDFWAEFATPEPDADVDADADADADQIPLEAPAHDGMGAEAAITATPAEPDQTVAETEAAMELGDAEPEPLSEDRGEPDGTTAAPATGEPLKRAFWQRTVAPWSWPLAEAESPAAPASSIASPASRVEATPRPATDEARPEPAVDDQAPGFDQGFFQRDEPVGSRFVDFDEVRQELVRIGVVWLGESDAKPVTALLSKTRSTIDDFVATIDTIRGLHVEGQDPASIQAMAREMHQQAAERLSGA